MTLNKLKDRMSSVKSVQKITGAMKSISSIYLKSSQKEYELANDRYNIIHSYLSSIINSFGYSTNNIFSLFKDNFKNFEKDNVIKEYFNINKETQISGYFKHCNNNLNMKNPLIKNVINKKFKKIQVVLSSEGGLCGSFFSKFFNNLNNQIKNKNYKKDIKDDILIITNSQKFIDRFNLEYKQNNILYIEKDFINIVLFLLLFFENNFISTSIAYSKFINTMKSLYKNYNIFNFYRDDKTCDIIDINESTLKIYCLSYLKSYINLIVSNNVLCEHSARLVSMDAASNNAKNLYDEIEYEYYSARQSSITNELIEIISASEGLE